MTELEIFDHDDEGYLAWIGDHQTGFVVNCHANPATDVVMLHRASCMHISVPGSNMEHWTHEYIKVCSDRNGPLLAWCSERIGERPQRCSTCAPLSSPREPT